jgi:hypothetical protein
MHIQPNVTAAMTVEPATRRPRTDWSRRSAGSPPPAGTAPRSADNEIRFRRRAQWSLLPAVRFSVLAAMFPTASVDSELLGRPLCRAIFTIRRKARTLLLGVGPAPSYDGCFATRSVRRDRGALRRATARRGTRGAEGATRPETLRHPYGRISRALESGPVRKRLVHRRGAARRGLRLISQVTGQRGDRRWPVAPFFFGAAGRRKRPKRRA